MKSLKRLSAAIAFTFALALAAFADCAPPGEILMPPCSVAQKTPGPNYAGRGTVSTGFKRRGRAHNFRDNPGCAPKRAVALLTAA